MTYTYSEWMLTPVIVTIIIMILFGIKDCYVNKNFNPFSIFIVGFTIFMLFIVFLLPIDKKQKQYEEIYGKNMVWLVDYKNKQAYNDFKEVKNCVNNGYDNIFESLDSSKYYYDYLNIELTEKEISFSQFINYPREANVSQISKIKVELHKSTVVQTIEGLLKTNIDNSNVYYSIDGYILGKDEKGQIESLSNNQMVRLDIVYNKDSCKDSKNITEYKIIKAETK